MSLLDVSNYGAVGGGLGTTIAGAGLNLTDVRNDSGQDWLESTDSADLAAFYLAQADAETTSRGILFPRDTYIFTATAFVHSGLYIDLGGSRVINTADGDTRFGGARTPFFFGLFGRYDLPRFDTQGWTQTAADLTEDDLTLTVTSGTMPDPGDVLMIRTSSLLVATSPILPTYTTFNKVASVSGSVVTLAYPMERAMIGVQFVNYNKITVTKASLAPGGAPHVYYCATDVMLINGTLETIAGGSVIGVAAMLNGYLDVRLDGDVCYGVYGNGFNRSFVRAHGRFGGTKGPVELAIGSALSTIEVDLKFSGVSTDYSGEDPANYSIVQFGEVTHRCTVRGRIDAGDKPCNAGVAYTQGDRNITDLELVARGAVQPLISFGGNAQVFGNRAMGHYTGGVGTGWHGRWSSGGGGDNWIVDADFEGTPVQASLTFQGPNLGGARGITAQAGAVTFSTGATVGNRVFDAYVAGGVGSGTTPEAVSIKTSTGSWPEIDVIQDYNANTTLFNRQQYGRTIRNAGATAIRTIPLAAAVPGMWLRAYRDNATFAFRIDPNGTDVIGTGGAGKYLSLDSDGAWVLIRSYKTGVWIIEASGGIIAYEP